MCSRTSLLLQIPWECEQFQQNIEVVLRFRLLGVGMR